MAKGKPETGSVKFSTKKCYECFTHLPLNATVCNSCKKKVGKVDRNGIAEKPIDLKSYLVFGLALVAFLVFLWKVFLR